MNATIASEENREKMNAIKKFNEGIMNSFKKIRIRSIGAVLLGACAGLSLTASVLPSVFSTMGAGESFIIRWSLAGYATYAMMAWGVGGWSARRVANPAAASVIMAVVGLVSGILLTYAEIDRTLPMLLAGGAASMVYGGIGGLLIARTLGGEKKSDGPPSSRQNNRKSNEVRFFRFFR